MKWAGAALLIASSWLAGLCAAAELRRRAELLTLFGDSIRLIQTEIRYNLSLLDEVLRRLRADERFAPLMFYARLRPAEPWGPQLCASLFPRRFPLTASDRALILGFLSGLGGSDAEGQAANCALYEAKAAAAAQEAAARAVRVGGLWRKLSPLGGVMLALLLL